MCHLQWQWFRPSLPQHCHWQQQTVWHLQSCHVLKQVLLFGVNWYWLIMSIARIQDKARGYKISSFSSSWLPQGSDGFNIEIGRTSEVYPMAWWLLQMLWPHIKWTTGGYIIHPLKWTDRHACLYLPAVHQQQLWAWDRDAFYRPHPPQLHDHARNQAVVQCNSPLHSQL